MQALSIISVLWRKKIEFYKGKNDHEANVIAARSLWGRCEPPSGQVFTLWVDWVLVSSIVTWNGTLNSKNCHWNFEKQSESILKKVSLRAARIFMRIGNLWLWKPKKSGKLLVTPPPPSPTKPNEGGKLLVTLLPPTPTRIFRRLSILLTIPQWKPWRVKKGLQEAKPPNVFKAIKRLTILQWH